MPGAVDPWLRNCEQHTIRRHCLAYIGEEEEHAHSNDDDDGGLRQRAQVGRELGADLVHADEHLVLRPQHNM